MLFSVEQAFVGREEIRAPLKTPAWEASKRYDVHGQEGENNLGSMLPKNPKGAKRKNNGSLIIINKSPSAERKSVVPFLDFFLKSL